MAKPTKFFPVAAVLNFLAEFCLYNIDPEYPRFN
jgi:hypothetical protein